MWAMKEIHMTDEHAVTSMVEAARDGDAAAWNRLVERYLPLVVAVAGRYRLNADEVADVSQTLWLRLVEHLDEIREPRALPGWIVTTTRNEAFRLHQDPEQDPVHRPPERLGALRRGRQGAR